MALARQGSGGDAIDLLNGLMEIDYSALSEKEKQDLLRTVEVILYRYDDAAAPVKSDLVAYLSPNFPADDNLLNRSLSVLLTHLEAPDAVGEDFGIATNSQRRRRLSKDLHFFF